MAPIPLWSGNLRLSLVLIPVRLFPAVTEEEKISFRMIHAPTGNPIKYQKGIETERGFKEVPEEKIVKGYEHAKGHHVILKPDEIDKLKLEAKHTIDMVRFVDEDEIGDQYWEKPYYLLPDGDAADEGYVVIREALAATGKVAIGQLVMHGREHLVGIKALGKGLVLEILRYGHEVRPCEPYFEKLPSHAPKDAVQLAAELIARQAGPFEPEKIPDEYARAVHELVRSKVEGRPPEVEIAEEKPSAQVINIMAALKASMQAKGRAKVRDAVRRRKAAPKEKAAPLRARAKSRPSRTAH
jgi:DNA end-binding protein Ku